MFLTSAVKNSIKLSGFELLDDIFIHLSLIPLFMVHHEDILWTPNVNNRQVSTKFVLNMVGDLSLDINQQFCIFTFEVSYKGKIAQEHTPLRSMNLVKGDASGHGLLEHPYMKATYLDIENVREEVSHIREPTDSLEECDELHLLVAEFMSYFKDSKIVDNASAHQFIGKFGLHDEEDNLINPPPSPFLPNIQTAPLFPYLNVFDVNGCMLAVCLGTFYGRIYYNVI